MSEQPYSLDDDGNFIVRPKLDDCFCTPCGNRVVVRSIYLGGVVFDNYSRVKAVELFKYTYIGGTQHGENTAHVDTQMSSAGKD